MLTASTTTQGPPTYVGRKSGINCTTRPIRFQTQSRAPFSPTIRRAHGPLALWPLSTVGWPHPPPPFFLFSLNFRRHGLGVTLTQAAACNVEHGGAEAPARLTAGNAAIDASLMPLTTTVWRPGQPVKPAPQSSQCLSTKAKVPVRPSKMICTVSSLHPSQDL